ncbi:MAG: SDR family oxidoreductase [Pseudomonadota bacterium]
MKGNGDVVINDAPVLVTGATGYIGGRLVPRLLANGVHVRAFGRSMDKLACRPWSAHPRVTLVQGDVLDADTLAQAAKGCRAIFYLVHSMISKKSAYVEADRRAAKNLVHAAARGGVDRIIYLGGLGESDHRNISRHLRSRHEVARILQSGPVPATVLRAAMILGSGSASFEILRYLVDRLPVMITPKWVHTPTQPIAIGNVLGYLAGCLENDAVVGQTFDIGGPEVLTYADLIRIFSEEAGLPQRKVIPLPILSAGLSARWIHLITPVPASIARPLTEGLSLPTICTENRIREYIPQLLLTCREAIGIALKRLAQSQIDTCWSDAGKLVPPEWANCGDAQWAGGTILECGYRAIIRATPLETWAPISRIGGKTGWYAADFLWRIRSVLDRLAGGFGLRRGRRHPIDLSAGDALDFWRVLEVTPAQRLLLLAEMKMPGEALLDIQITPRGKSETELQLLSRFLPRGLAGLCYWYMLYPFHQWVFTRMLMGIAHAIDRPIVGYPERFTPVIPDSCRIL